MTDLVERLRGRGRPPSVTLPDILHEAADEIERLRATLASIEQRPDTPEHIKAVIRNRLGD